MLPTKILEKYNLLTVQEAKQLFKDSAKTTFYIAPLFKVPGDNVILLEDGRSITLKSGSSIVALSALCPDALSFIESQAVASCVARKLMGILVLKEVPVLQEAPAKEDPQQDLTDIPNDTFSPSQDDPLILTTTVEPESVPQVAIVAKVGASKSKSIKAK